MQRFGQEMVMEIVLSPGKRTKLCGSKCTINYLSRPIVAQDEFEVMSPSNGVSLLRWKCFPFPSYLKKSLRLKLSLSMQLTMSSLSVPLQRWPITLFRTSGILSCNLEKWRFRFYQSLSGCEVNEESAHKRKWSERSRAEILTFGDKGQTEEFGILAIGFQCWTYSRNQTGSCWEQFGFGR